MNDLLYEQTTHRETIPTLDLPTKRQQVVVMHLFELYIMVAYRLSVLQHDLYKKGFECKIGTTTHNHVG